MANRDEIEFTYSLIDRIFRLSLGELADFSGALYGGDFSLSLEQAQRRKHEYVAEQIGIGPGRRVLDLGCGWGPLLDFARRREADGVGVTLSSAQAAACRRHGLEVHLHDALAVTRDTSGLFDAVASLGACEHFLLPRAARRRPPGGDLPGPVRERRGPVAAARPVPARSCRPGASSSSTARRRTCASRGEHERAAGLHRDDRAMAAALRGA